MRARLGCLVIAASIVISATPARADDLADAQVHLDRGVVAYRAGDYRLAHHELLAAQALAPDHANPYRWLALAEVQLDDCRDALVHIDAFVERARPEDPRRDEMLRLRARCEAPPPPPPQHRSHRWWWIAGGAIAGGAALGVFFATRGDGVTALPPVHCGDTGCTP